MYIYIYIYIYIHTNPQPPSPQQTEPHAETMSDQIARAEDCEKKAEKKLSGWGLFSSKYEDAADLFDKAANSFKLAKSWDQAGSTYIKLANCHLKMDC
ncbi:alpha-soluble NSF attachment protein-like [Rhododendron vialii]|uniref:alpha-soluble NSF attachment protein-like n=1 Tax=Rhododendron vialii TaxID=182163 RepID=UPI00265E80E7|nr:alpha-soluble NSF attachment protein-like [Rhododendron vialii]